MIEITLRFSSVAEAAGALNQLNGTQLAAATVADTKPASTKPVKEVKPTTPPADKPAAEPTKAAVTEVKADTTKDTTTVAAGIDYPTLQKAVFSLVGTVKAKGLDPAEHVLGIAKSFGFANFAAMKDAGPEGAKHFAASLAAVEAKATELEAA